MKDAVGPVLVAGAAAQAVIAAIREENLRVVVEDRGSYLRVLVSGRCHVTRDAIERALGRSFELPGDLEAIMPSFQGSFEVNEEAAEWSLKGSQ